MSAREDSAREDSAREDSVREDSAREELERRYRRLLAYYPARHRREHGEEMLGVLLAAAPEGQRRPPLADALNLLWGALAIRLRPRRDSQAGQGSGEWRDALAVFSIVAPVALAVLWISADLTGLLVSPGGRVGVNGLPGRALGLAIFGLGLALPFVLLRLRRIAAFVCLAAAVLFAALSARSIYGDLTEAVIGGGVLASPLFAYATEAAALFASPGPRRGLQLLTRRSWALIVAAATVTGVLIASGLYARYGYRGHVPVAAIAAAAVVAIAIGVAARPGLRRRVLLVFALPLYPLLAAMFWSPAGALVSDVIVYLPPLAIAALAVVTARRPWRADAGGGQATRA
jgi:hypothetical protein